MPRMKTMKMTYFSPVPFLGISHMGLFKISSIRVFQAFPFFVSATWKPNIRSGREKVNNFEDVGDAQDFDENILASSLIPEQANAVDVDITG